MFGKFGKWAKDVAKVLNLSLDDPKAWNPNLWQFADNQTLSGENVTESTALTYSAVYNAISLISGTVGSLPLDLKQKVGNKNEFLRGQKLYTVMHDRWNPYITAMAGREAIQAHALSWGNGYAEIVRDRVGDIIELWPIAPNRVVGMKMVDDKLIYVIQVGNERIDKRSEDILHVPGLGFDGFTGYSVISLASKSIGLSMAIESFGSLYFGQGTHPGMVVTHPNVLSEQASGNLQKNLAAEYAGLGRSHRLMLLEEGMSIEKIGIPPNDSQFIESKAFQIPEIARWFNLPPHKLKDLSKSSFNNIEAEQTSFVTDSILPWLIRFEQNYNSQLLTDRDRKESVYFKHNVDGLLRGNSKDRALLYRTMWANGFMTQNEVRMKEDMDPVDDEFADELWVPLNMTPLSKFKEIEEEPEEEPAVPPLELIETQQGGQNAANES